MDSDNHFDPLQLLMSYQSACQQFDVEAAVAHFAADGALAYGGQSLTGRAALLEAHRWDRAARNRVAFLEPRVSGDQINLILANQHELHRLLGLEGVRSPAEMVIRSDGIHLFSILAPEPASLQALRAKGAPFFAWVNQHQRESWQRTATLDEAGGQALYELAHAWRTQNSAA